VELRGKDLLCFSKIKFTKLAYENVRMIINLPTKRYRAANILEFHTQDGDENHLA